MIRKFDAKNFKWDGIETLVYKQDGSPFKDVTRQVLYDGAYDIPCQFRYFECSVLIRAIILVFFAW